MFSRLAVVCVFALAVVAQAGHEKHHSHSHKNGTLTHNPFHVYDHKPSGHHGPSGSAGYPAEAGISSGVAPYPTGTGGSSPLSTGASPRLLTTGAVPTYTTTVIVTKLTTYCPGPTSLTQNGKTYIVTKETTLTINDCPCTSTYTTTGFPLPTQSGDTTLTYVIGTGSSTTTVVTTIHHTSYKTNYNTVYTSAGQPGEGGENGASGPPVGYQTVRSTIQSTIYVSAVPTAGSGPGTPGEGGATGSACVAPVTVTVTGPEETVTVTATSTPGSGPFPSSVVVGSPASSAPVSSSAPYAMNNGTQPTGTGASTGFLTKPSASFTLKPSSGIAPSSGVTSASTVPSSGIAPSSSVATPSATAPSSSSTVWPAVMATAEVHAYN